MTMKKFNKTLTFTESNRSSEHYQANNTGRQRLSVTRLSAKMADRNMDHLSRFQAMQPLDTKIPMDYANGLMGNFAQVQNDFTISSVDCCGELQQGQADDGELDRYCDDPHWPPEAKEKVKRVRFVICTLALFGLALGMMSRLILNVSIVEMVKRADEMPVQVLEHSDLLEPATHTDDLSMGELDALGSRSEPLWQPANSSHQAETNETQPQVTIQTSGGINPDESPQSDDSGDLKFQWTKKEVNILLGSFYIGYGPGILFSGGVAQQYGAKYPLFLCVFGSAVINILTPISAQYSLNLLIALRILLGLIQGSLLPCLYELFNRWLTQTEASIFAPMIKVSIPMGSLIGTTIPGILASFKLDWPVLFYIGGVMCLVWSIVWLFLATSLPQDNRLIGVEELNRIMRKKKNNPLNQPATITEKKPSNCRQQHEAPNGVAQARGNGTPWWLIITSPSVLALTVVKFTYNIGMDFIFLQLAVYLREVHSAPIETISVIASGGYLMQMLLISFVGWLAKVVIINQTCGLSVTKWRKLFQGSSNFFMALAYFALAYLSPTIGLSTALLLSVCFWWMMGAGGESMLPYDLSGEYPASIVGFAHSFSIFSGIALTAICDVVIGEDTENPEKWGLLFYILAGLLASGGLVFVLVVKAKPFLPGEKTPKAVRREMKLRQKRSISLSGRDKMKSNKLNDFRWRSWLEPPKSKLRLEPDPDEPADSVQTCQQSHRTEIASESDLS